MSNKAILINAKDKTITEVTIETYKDIYKFCGFDLFTCVQMDAKGNTLYVDDEGLLNGTDFGFIVKGYDQPLMGNAIILGTNRRNGESEDTSLTTEQVFKMVSFFDRGFDA
jgi:hypothetical protein